MTNQNPAASQPQSPNLERDILAKVNAHADRSLDRIFADIDGLLGDDLETNTQSLSIDRAIPHQQHSTEYYPRTSAPQPPAPAQVYPPQQSIDPSPAATPKPKKSIPFWLKALLGIGATSIAVGGGLLWLVNERKIELPKNIDTSWLPFQSRSQVSPEDAKFAEYMRKSISKIESASTPVTSATNLPNPATSIAAPIAPTPTETISTAPAPATPTAAIKTPISLVKTFQTSNRPSAVFQIDSHSQTVHIGQKIGTSNWSLLTVAKGEVIVKRKGGEIRSIYVGQKF
jgi:hypothetical protein